MITIQADVRMQPDRADEILHRLQALSDQIGAVMATLQQFQERLASLDAATTEIANDLQALRDQLAAGEIPDNALAMLDERIAVLTQLGQDPEAPPQPPTT